MKRFIGILLGVYLIAVIFLNNSGIQIGGIHTAKYLSITPLELPLPGEEIDTKDLKMNVNDLSIIPKANEANVYKIKKNEIVDESFVNDLGLKLGIKSTAHFEENANSFICANNGKSLRIEKGNGKWTFTDETASQLISNINISNIDDKKILLDTQEQMKQIGFDMNLFGNGIVTDTTESNGADFSTRVIGKDIYFYRKFMGKPLLGVSRLIVSVGQNCKINSIQKLYRDIDSNPYKVKIKTYDDVVKSITDGNAIVSTESKSKNINITSIKLEYWEDPDNDYLQPVYVLNGHSSSKNTDNFQAIVTAVK